MTRSRWIIGAALLLLLAAVAGCAGGSEPSEMVNTLTIKGRVIVDAYRYDEATGDYVHFYHHESSNLLVNIGKDYIEDQLGDTPLGDPAKWISLSTDATAPDVAWTQIPNEIIADGLERAVGGYTSTGVGAWEIQAVFTATATHTDVRLTGLQWALAPLGGNLMAANTFTPVTLNSGDTLTVTWQLSIS